MPARTSSGVAVTPAVTSTGLAPGLRARFALEAVDLLDRVRCARRHVTVAEADVIGTSQPLPVTFQKNSSWSAKGLSAPVSV